MKRRLAWRELNFKLGGMLSREDGSGEFVGWTRVNLHVDDSVVLEISKVNTVNHAEPVFLTIPKAAEGSGGPVEFFQRHLKEYGLAARNIVNSRSAKEAILKESPHLRTFVELPVVPDAILPAGFETRLPEFRNIVLKHVSNVLIRDLDAKAEMDAAQAELEEKLAKSLIAPP